MGELSLAPCRPLAGRATPRDQDVSPTCKWQNQLEQAPAPAIRHKSFAGGLGVTRKASVAGFWATAMHWLDEVGAKELEGGRGRRRCEALRLDRGQALA